MQNFMAKCVVFWGNGLYTQHSQASVESRLFLPDYLGSRVLLE